MLGRFVWWLQETTARLRVQDVACSCRFRNVGFEFMRTKQGYERRHRPASPEPTKPSIHQATIKKVVWCEWISLQSSASCVPPPTPPIARGSLSISLSLSPLFFFSFPLFCVPSRSLHNLCPHGKYAWCSRLSQCDSQSCHRPQKISFVSISG